MYNMQTIQPTVPNGVPIGTPISQIYNPLIAPQPFGQNVEVYNPSRLIKDAQYDNGVYKISAKGRSMKPSALELIAQNKVLFDDPDPEPDPESQTNNNGGENIVTTVVKTVVKETLYLIFDIATKLVKG